MNKALRGRVLTLVAGVVGLSAAAMPLWAAEADEAALAERIAALADRFGNTTASAPVRSRLLEAASRLSPGEIRFRRERYRAAVQAGDSDSALASLIEWRKLEPENLVVQMRYIDANLQNLETADAKLKYLNSIVDAQSVNAEVRSHAAMQAQRILMEQSRTQQAFEMGRKALTLFPLNIEAMQLQWQMLAPNATPPQRVGYALSILQADPSSVDAATRVARELAEANLVQESLQWYSHAAMMAAPVGGLAPDDARAVAAQLIIAGQEKDAGALIARLLERNDADPGAWMLALLAERNQAGRIEQVRKNVVIGLVNRLTQVRTRLGVKGLSPRALGSDDSSIPDLSSDAELVKSASASLRQQYTAAVADLAWVLIYNADRVADAQPLISAIPSADPDAASTVARLQGWTLLKSGKSDEAMAKLSPHAREDALAALGVIQIQRRNPNEQAAAAEAARKLITACPSQLVGAVVRVEVADLAGAMPPDAMTDAIRESLEHFPKEILRAAKAPQEFISLRLIPVQVMHEVGEPIIAEIELRNLQDSPLLVGPNGIAHEVWIDVRTRGLVEQMVSGAVLDPVDGPIRLAPNGSLKWRSRIDRGPLAEVLEKTVTQAMQLTVSGLTNPVPSEIGIVPGACGVRGRMNQLVSRRAAALTSDDALRRAHEQVVGADELAQLRLVDQIVAHLRWTGDADVGRTLRPIEADLRDMLGKLASGGPTVRAWATYQKLRAGMEPAENVSGQLTQDAMWYGRVLSAVAAAQVQGDQREAALKKLEEDADATVRRLASAVRALPPATQPQVQPAEGAQTPMSPKP